ncbi:AIM24 family protein [Actinocorallia sp. A-T 12471]|uniref:AIM24 family protein n=1 Tax=Actinocorallia sp. A-T 12471 TaxID=3089813 RepID=UPI0029D29966|nr:AIM24 family protein [Actinocorallia sp. A-T 12471]MDX6740527.1 AIM24 family protein [Actinocorallia sp. A-T 12471]
MAQYRMNGSNMLAVDLMGETIRALNGSMVAYEGQMTFKRQGMTGGEGLMGAVRRRVAGESMTLMEISGQGTVYLAHEATEINLVPLQGDTLLVESDSLLALDGQLSTGVQFTGLRGMTSGQGLATTKVEGHGTVAILSDGPAIALEVTQQQPLSVDPQAYVAHRGQLQQDFVTDVNWRTVLGQGSGESFQLRFTGHGLVYIQPAERGGGLAGEV